MGARRVGDDPSLAVDGPFGIRATVSGAGLVNAVFVVSVIGLILTALWYHNTLTVEDNTKVQRKLDELVWVMSLPDDKRRALDLPMPESLRDKMRRGRLQREESP